MFYYRYSFSPPTTTTTYYSSDYTSPARVPQTRCGPSHYYLYYYLTSYSTHRWKTPSPYSLYLLFYHYYYSHHFTWWFNPFLLDCSSYCSTTTCSMCAGTIGYWRWVCLIGSWAITSFRDSKCYSVLISTSMYSAATFSAWSSALSSPS